MWWGGKNECGAYLGVDLDSAVGADVLLRVHSRPDEPLFFASPSFGVCSSADPTLSMMVALTVLWDVPGPLNHLGRGHHIRGRCWHAQGLSLRAYPCFGERLLPWIPHSCTLSGLCSAGPMRLVSPANFRKASSAADTQSIGWSEGIKLSSVQLEVPRLPWQCGAV